MQVLDVHAAFLSNHEVLALLREDVKEQEAALKKYKNSVPKAHRNASKPIDGQPYIDFDKALGKIVPDNLRTLQVESLTYLTQDALPCKHQTPSSIKQSLEALAKVPTLPEATDARGSNALTRTEKLMLVNLAPKAVVDLHVVIDELEARFSEEAIEQMLEIFTSMEEATASHQAEVKAEHAKDAAQDEEDEAARLEDREEDRHQKLEDETYADEPDDLDASVYMPDEENDLIDEGAGDGGRDTDIRDIDEVGES